jgi:hypothetical protein
MTRIANVGMITKANVLPVEKSSANFAKGNLLATGANLTKPNISQAERSSAEVSSNEHSPAEQAIHAPNWNKGRAPAADGSSSPPSPASGGAASSAMGTEYHLTFRAVGATPPPIVRLRQLLKVALRRFNLVCTDVKELPSKMNQSGGRNAGRS